MKSNTNLSKTRNTLATIAATALLATSGMAVACGGGMASNMGGKHSKGQGFNKGGMHAPMSAEQREQMQAKRLERMTNALNLTDTQQKQVQAVFAQNQSKHSSLHEKTQALREELRQQRTQNASHTNREATHDALYQAQKQIRALRDQERKQIDAILTSEQRAKMAQIQAKGVEKRGERGGFGR